jgi:hypothetical protein
MKADVSVAILDSIRKPHVLAERAKAEHEVRRRTRPMVSFVNVARVGARRIHPAFRGSVGQCPAGKPVWAGRQRH